MLRTDHGKSRIKAGRTVRTWLHSSGEILGQDESKLVLDSGYVLKVLPTGFATGWIRCEPSEKKSERTPRCSGLSHWTSGVAVYWDGGRGGFVGKDGEELHAELRVFSLMGLSLDHTGVSGRSWVCACGVLSTRRRGKLGSPQHTGFTWSHETDWKHRGSGCSQWHWASLVKRQKWVVGERRGGGEEPGGADELCQTLLAGEDWGLTFGLNNVEVHRCPW